MLEQYYTAQQSEAGPSTPRKTKEIVPTSDDEDIFFVSQSSDKYKSSSSSASSTWRGQEADQQDDEDDDQEPILPTRHSPASGRYNTEPSSAAIIPLRTPYSITDVENRAARSDDRIDVHTSSIQPVSISDMQQTPLPSPLDTATLSPDSNPSNRFSPSSPLHPPDTVTENKDRVLHEASAITSTEASAYIRAGVLEPTLGHYRKLLATELDGDVTPRSVEMALPSSQQSDATLPFEGNCFASQQPSTPLSPLSSTSQSSLVRDDSQPIVQLPALPHENVQDCPSPKLVMSDGDHDLASDDRALKSTRTRDEVGHCSRRSVSPSSYPPLPPLRIPSRDSAPPIPISREDPQQPPSAEPQGNNDVALDDEQLARAAAAQPPTPPRRQLRSRKAAQLNPYTLEAARYQRALIRNDWGDAVVSQREWHRQERKRLAEEAARAQRDLAGAQGSAESQSQWLLPSSGPSSQADHEDLSSPSSPATRSMPEVFVEIPAFTETSSVRWGTDGSRVELASPTPSQSSRLPDVAEMLASRDLMLDPHRDRPGISRHATYKGPRTTARPVSDDQTAPRQVSEDSQVNEDDAVPLPLLTRRKHPQRALAPSDVGDAPSSNSREPITHEAFLVDSSEDERPAPGPPIAKARRRSRWSGDGSSSDSTDYERRFRQLKKMMPAGMARKHIRDLRAMRHGKAYHSDGHQSSSSSETGVRSRMAPRPQAERVNAMEISDDEDLQPGQTRKRLRRHDSTNGHNALLLDPDSDSSSSSASSVSSQASVFFENANLADPDMTADGIEAEEIDDRAAQWWSVSRLDSQIPYTERDAIDRMLSRTNGRKPSSHISVRRAIGASRHRQSRLDGFVSTHRERERTSTSKRSHLQEIDQNLWRQQRSKDDALHKEARPLVSRRQKKRKKLDPRVGRTTTSGAKRGSGPLHNPPVARPRARPRLDLEQHEVFFAANPSKPRYAGIKNNDDTAFRDDEQSDEDRQWQILGHALRDPTPVAVPDPRLAGPRARAGIAAQLGSDGAVPSPVRDIRSSPSASLSSTGVGRLHTVNVHSPGTPTRPRLDACPQKAPLRAFPGPASTLRLGSVGDTTGSDAWDDFEGVSLDFGMAPFADDKQLEIADSSLLSRLPDLIALQDRLLRYEHVPPTWTGEVLRLEDTVLDIAMEHDDLATKLPFYVDNLRFMISRTFVNSSDRSEIDPGRHANRLVKDTCAFLACWLTRQAQDFGDNRIDAHLIFRSYRTILERCEQLQAAVLNETGCPSRASREDRKSICLQLAWMRFELCWRAMAICDADADFALEPEAPTVVDLMTYSRTLMSLLLHHGLHRCVSNVRKVTMAQNTETHPDGDATVGDEGHAASMAIDEATSMWLGVIHLLTSFEKSRGIMEGRLFWTQFEIAYQRWDESMPKREPLLRSESLWYCLFALEMLSQISPGASIQDSPLLRECWPLVTRALSLVQFRSDESKELASGWHVLAKRDAYVRIVLQRCCLLTSEWRWTMEGAEGALARLFDIFNSHKLADLPTEKEHDFPAFLRDFDVEKLSTADVVGGEAIQDPGFHLFIRLLGKAGQELRVSAVDAKEGDRRISRLFSRMTPVRVMPFTRSDVPTSSQRSVLFNHYNVVMLFLYLVPASAPQRLRQIQSFLPAFKDADFVSQVTCVRAMMYVATILRHHHMDLSPVTRWFGETITALRREYEEIDSAARQFERRQVRESFQAARGAQIAPRTDATRMAAPFENAPARQAALRRKEELARLLVVALRSIQHIIRHGDLDGGRPQPVGSEQRILDHSLLSPAWTQQMMESQISLEPRIGQEVLKCIQTFLLARIKFLQPAESEMATAKASCRDRQTTSADTLQQRTQNDESQDSFAELFEADDDFDFEDPLLARLLDDVDTSLKLDTRDTDHASKAVAIAAAASEKKRWDREFAGLVKATISPSLFQLLSNIYHPDRRMEAAASGAVVMGLGVTERLDEMPADRPADDSNRSRVTTSRTKMDRLLKVAEARQYLELVVDCWAGCAQVLVTNGLREWSSYLGFGNESWKRIVDPIGRRDVGLRFLQNVLSLDPAAVQKREYEVEFLAVWIQTAAARVLSIQDVYTKSLIEAAPEGSNQASLLHTLATQWRDAISDSSSSPGVVGHEVTTRSGLSLDLESFTHHRQILLSSTLSTLATSLTNNTTTVGTANSILSALLSSLRAYVEDTSVSENAGRSKAGSLDYLRFCQETLLDVKSILGASSVMMSLKSEYGAALQLVQARLAMIDRGHP